MFEKDMKFPRLLDVYGALLTDRKRELLELYYNEDCSLAEISELTGISRQGVRDSIRKSQDEINGWEDRRQLLEAKTCLRFQCGILSCDVVSQCGALYDKKFHNSMLNA